MWKAKETVVIAMLFCSVLAASAVGTKSEMDVETLLEKVRKSQRPTENMRIKWINYAFGPGVSAKGLYRLEKRRGKRTDVIEEFNIKRQCDGLVTTAGSRIEGRHGLAGRDGKSWIIARRTEVCNGTSKRSLERKIKYPKPYPNGGHVGITREKTCSTYWQAFSARQNFPIHDKDKYGDFDLTLMKGNIPGVFVLKAVRREPTWYELITIDGNRGYNVIKREKFRKRDDYKMHEDNYTVKQYRNGTWFIKERERTNFILITSKLPKPRITDRAEITRVEFNVPEPDRDRFRLQFPKGTTVADPLWYYHRHTDFLVGCLSEAKHTQEDSVVGAILDQQAGEERTAGPNEVFGAVTELVVNNVEERKDCFIDFDTGKLVSFPPAADFHDLRWREWLKENGVDGRVETNEGLCGLWTFNTVVIPVSNKRWDSITPAACNSVLEKVKGIFPPIMSAEGRLPEKLKGIYPPIMSAEGRLPATFLFQTCDNRGILQILEVERNTRPKHVKIRYKMLQAGTKAG